MLALSELSPALSEVSLALSEVLLALLVLLFTARYFKLWWSRRRLPPGPTPLPLIGNLWTLRFELRYDTLMQLGKVYGNIFTVWLGQTPVVVLYGCQTIRNALVSHSEELSGRPLTHVFEELSKGKGVIFTSGHTWKQQRRFALMTLRNLGLGKRSLEGRIQDEAQQLVEYFAKHNGKVLDPSLALVHSVVNVISSVVYGHGYSSKDKEFHQLLEASKLFENFAGGKWALLFDTCPWLMRHVPGPHQDLFKFNAFIEDFVRNEIKIHKENGIPEEPQDLIDFYLQQMSKASDDATSTFDEDNMMRLVGEMFVAGMDTTSTALRWALLHMATQPEIQEKVQEELHSVLRESQIIQYEDRMRLPYTNAVIHETQRYSNVAGTGLLRQVVKETTLQGFKMKKGTIVIPNLSSSLYDPDHWETPHQFNPGHFLDKEGNFVTNEAFLPFSAGHRVCLGEQLAKTELFIFISSLLHAFTFRLPEGVTEPNMDSIMGSALKPHPYEICAVPR